MFPDKNAQSSLNDPSAVSPADDRRSSKWDIANAPKNYVSLIAFQFLSAAFSFATVWLITRHLGSEGYGSIFAVIAASQVAQVFVNWTGTALVRFGVDEFVDTAKIARTFWVRLIVLTVNLVGVTALSYLWFPLISDWLKLSSDAYWLVLAHFGITAIWIHIQMSLQAAKLPRVQGFLQMVERLLIILGIGALIATASLRPFEAVICYIAAPSVMIVVGLFKLRHLITARFELDKSFVKKVVAYSLPLLPYSLLGYFSGNYVDAIFVSYFLSTSDLGIYAVATQMNGILLQLPTLANTLLLPLFVSLNNEKLTEKLKLYFTDALPTFVLMGGFAGIIVAVLGYLLIPIVFREEFAAATVPLWILISSSVVALPVLLGYASATHSSSLTYIATIAAVFSAIVNVGLNLWLIPVWGIEGCAWATVGAILTSAIFFAILLKRKADIPTSWSFAAIIPNLSAAIIFSMSHNLYLAIVVGFVLTVGLGLVKFESLKIGLSVMMRSYK